MADDLFTGLQSSDDLIQHIKLMLDKKAIEFHVSFGVWRARGGSIKHETLLMLTTKTGKLVQKKVEGNTVKDMFNNVDQFLKEVTA